MPIRHDYTPVGFLKRTDEGFLHAEAIVTRAGIFRYVKADGSISKEYRPAEEVFKEDSVESLKLRPVTNGHPAQKMVDSSTAKLLKVGSTGETTKRTDDDHLAITLVVTDSDAVEDVMVNKKNFLSCGYTCDVEEKPGMFNGERYDVIQRNIVYNHVALCHTPRAGNKAQIKIDEDDGVMVLNQQQEAIMPKKRIDGVEYEAAEQVIIYAEKLESKNDSLSKENESLKSQVSESAKKLDEVSSELKKEKEGRADSIAAAVRARLSLERAAERFLKEEKLDEMSDMEIKKAVISKAFPKADLSEKDSVYISGRFDSAVEYLEEAASLNKEDVPGKKEEKNDDEDPREKMKARIQYPFKGDK